MSSESNICMGITKANKPCKNKTLKSNYCYLHTNQNKKLIQEAIIPEVAAKIMEFSGGNINLNKQTTKLTYTTEKRELQKWFKTIHIQYSITDIPNFLIPDLYKYYIQYLNDVKLDCPDNLKYIFYSNIINVDFLNAFNIEIDTDSKKQINIVHSYNPEYSNSVLFPIPNENLNTDKTQIQFDFKTIDLYLKSIDFSDIYLIDSTVQKLNYLCKLLVNFSKLKIGDVVHIADFGDYRNDGKLIFDGTRLRDLANVPDDYGTVPHIFEINDFPRLDYFSESIKHNDYVSLRFNKNNTYLVYKNPKFYHFKVDDKYDVFTDYDLLQNLEETKVAKSKRLLNESLDLHINDYKLYKFFRQFNNIYLEDGLDMLDLVDDNEFINYVKNVYKNNKNLLFRI